MEQPRTECNFLVEGGNVESQSPKHGELPDLADVLKCIVIECDALLQAQN